MKDLLSLLLFFFSISSLYAQGNINYNIRVMDNDGISLKSMNIVAIEKNTLDKVTAITDISGNATMKLNNGKNWIIAVGEIKKAIQITTIPFSIIDMKRNYYYDLKNYKRTKKQDPNRITTNYTLINEKFTSESKFQPPNCLLEISVKRPNGALLHNINVYIVNIDQKIVYKGITNNNGKAYFVLPNKSKYDIDIESLKNISYCDFEDEYKHQKLMIEYSPTIVNEKVINDTIYQTVTASSSPSSERALIRLNIQGGKRNGNNERVYLRELKTNTVYASSSDKNGAAYFLVPIKHIYMVDFNYQKDVDAVNLKYSSTMTKGTYEVFYSPDPKLEYPEDYIPTADRLLLKKFNTFLIKQYEKPKDSPFLLKFKSVLKINKSSKEALFLLTLASRNYETKRLPMNLTIVLDKSGSMYSSERSESLKKSLWKLGNLLSESDNVSVVLFDEGAIRVQESTSGHIEKIKDIIENYEPSGGTNIFEGIKVGTSNLMKYYDPLKANKLILLTDGYGITPPKEITSYVDSIHKKDIIFSTIGLGTSYNQSLLELISKSGNGTFNHVDNSVHLSKVFLKEVEKSFDYVAKDIKIEIYHDKKLVYSNLYGFPTKNVINGKVFFEISKLSTDHNSIAYLKFNIDELTKEITDKPLKIKVSYLDIIKNKKVSYEQEILLEWTDETDTELLLDQEEKTLYAIAILNQSLKVMAEHFELGNNDNAKSSLISTKNQIEEIFPEAKPKEVKTLIEEVNNYISSFNQLEKNNLK